MKSLMIFNTPATPHKGIVSHQETHTKKSYYIHKSYRSGIGYLLYIVKHSQTELSNAVREIYKCMYGENMSHHKSLLHAIEYIIDTEDYFCQTKQDRNINGPW